MALFSSFFPAAYPAACPAGAPRHPQRGNALWFILLAIALLAALTIAITRTGDNVQQSGQAERSTVDAARIIRDGKAMEVAVQTMTSRGVSQSDICFDADFWGHDDYDFGACADTSNRVFAPEGAGLTQPRTAPGQTIAYTGTMAIDGVGSPAPDLVFVISGIDKTNCLRINRMLGIADIAGGPPTVTNPLTTDEFTGTYTTGNTVTAPGILRKIAGCVTGTPDAVHHYYHTLIAR